MSATTTALVETIPTIGAIGTPQSRSLSGADGIKNNGKDSIALKDFHDTPALATATSSANASEGEENSRPGASAVTPAMRRREKIVFAALCWALFLAGWNDGSVGPLLPRIQSHYHIGFAVVSIFWIAQCIGFIGGSIANIYFSDRWSFGMLLCVSSIFQVVGYSIQAAAPPFPLFCISATIIGFGAAVQDAQANGLVASLHEHASEKMGVLHAIYGVGALTAPLVSTQFSQHPRWSFHFLVSLGISVINTIVLVLIFRNKSLEAVLKSIGSPMAESSSIGHNMGEVTDRGEGENIAVTSGNSMGQILRLKVVHLMAIFILVYVGVEVTIGGWIVTFIINVRGGGPSSGYISSGFFGGLTLGRVALLWFNKLVGERRVLFLYSFLAIGLELVIWLVPSLIGNAVAVSIVGMLLGPMYPLCMNHAGRVLPRKLLAGSIGWIAGFGQAGSAVLPFMTGALSSRFGIKSLQPLLVAMMALMTVLWALIPNHPKRRD